ncbi:hypothetical protein FXF09_17155 [Vibrio cholerae]|nr:hypothetical protein [Vibrio cholerae]HDY7969897.1 hypothetical protein [Vibrio vulnificus]EGR0190294.1 hypothetical protein [Vibrio cholerae]EGR1403010.1 hypothetical protein [Vibrio cholerae]EGR1429580.1 hypothetical protein [Vibrio cholerae]EGR3866228.1 hypothetical protein [Vibrio cholerae]
MRNLDIFNCAAIEILHLSLDSFPSSAEIDPNKIAITVRGYFLDNEFSDINESIIVDKCSDTLAWLVSENYLVVNDEYLDAPSSVVLTQKGLNALNVKTKLLDSTDSKNFTEHFKGGLAQLPFNAVSSLMVDFFKSLS